MIPRGIRLWLPSALLLSQVPGEHGAGVLDVSFERGTPAVSLTGPCEVRERKREVGEGKEEGERERESAHTNSPPLRQCLYISKDMEMNKPNKSY